MLCLIAVTLATSLAWNKPPQHGYVVLGTGARIVPALYDAARPRARAEITSGSVVTFVEETPDMITEIAVASCGARIASAETGSRQSR